MYLSNVEIDEDIIVRPRNSNSIIDLRTVGAPRLILALGSKMRSFGMYNSKFSEVIVSSFATMEPFRVINSNIQELDFSFADLTSTIVITNSKVRKCNFHSTKLPGLLSLQDTEIGEMIDIRYAKLDSLRLLKKDYCKLNLRGVNIEKLKLSYEYFELYHPEKISLSTYDESVGVYEGLVKNFKNNGQQASLERVDKEFQEFKLTRHPDAHFGDVLLNWINKHWNDYGYAKGRIWAWTGGFFLFFWLVNWLRFPHIFHNNYQIKSIREILQERKIWGDLVYDSSKASFVNFRALDQSLIYTALVFFGLKLSIENFNFRNFRGVLYIGLQYVTGLICLAYLANFMISSGVIGG